jgi:hypothetical protein
VQKDERGTEEICIRHVDLQIPGFLSVSLSIHGNDDVSSFCAWKALAFISASSRTQSHP